MTVVRVLLVDDQAPFLRAMSAVVEETPGFEVMGEASSGEEALLAAAELLPGFVLMDVNLPSIDGLEATRQLRGRQSPPTTSASRPGRSRDRIPGPQRGRQVNHDASHGRSHPRHVGHHYADLPNPGLDVGVLLDASAQHAGRTGREILTIAQQYMGLPRRRVEQMLEVVSLTSTEASRRVGDYSLGMRQRLGIATALIGDPEVLILDEPANGLDPAGIRWMRDLLRGYADRGGTVLLSFHLLHEIEVIADDTVMIGNGRIVSQGTKTELLHAAAVVAHFILTFVLPTIFGLLADSQRWFHELQPRVDIQFAQSGLFVFDQALAGEQWAHIAVTGATWLFTPLARVWRSGWRP
jgi:CheY-like chemotaxis protein/ABC-type antimicrobial peptide transport system ATPase subunit